MMNSIMSFLVAVVMIFSGISVGAQVEFMFEPVNNCTQDMTFKMSFDNSREFAALLKELEIPSEFEAFADIEKFFETLFSVEGKIFAQADVSADMKKAQVAITSDDFNSIDFNRNLKIDISSKMGLWCIYDFTNEAEPVYEIIYMLPFMEKYVHIDLFDMMPEDERAQFVSIMGETMAKSQSEETKAFVMGLIEKHADVEMSLTKATVKIDNEGLIGIINDFIPYMMNITEKYLPEEEKEIIAEEIDSFNLDDIQLLGEKGMVYTFNFKNGKISTMSTDADISIDISGIYTSITGMEWNFVSEGKLDFTIETDVTVSKIGSTKVDMPAVTENNTVFLSEMIKNDMAVSMMPEEEAMAEYPNWYIGGETTYLPIINGEIYVPLRMTLESGYEESVNIGFENGSITVNCEYFPGFKTMTLSNGSDKIYLDGAEKVTSPVAIYGGTTYVSNKLFTEYFGWDFDEAWYDMLTNTYNYSFWVE